jgi:hypothetical protein
MPKMWIAAIAVFLAGTRHLPVGAIPSPLDSVSLRPSNGEYLGCWELKKRGSYRNVGFAELSCDVFTKIHIDDD